jgi:hypothetical protein
MSKPKPITPHVAVTTHLSVDSATALHRFAEDHGWSLTRALREAVAIALASTSKHKEQMPTM